MRAFVGVPIPPEPVLAALLEGLDATGADLKTVSPERMHVTLSFLGDVPDDATAPLSAALDAGVAGHKAFDLRLAGVGAFPNVRHPRVIWAGAEDPKPISDLATSVRRALARAGFPGDEREFRAHVTLARVKGGRNLAAAVSFLKEHGRDALPTLRVGVVRLYRTRLSAAGPAYDALHESALEA